MARLVAEPTEINFGFRPAGLRHVLPLTLSNLGSGEASVHVKLVSDRNVFTTNAASIIGVDVNGYFEIVSGATTENLLVEFESGENAPSQSYEGTLQVIGYTDEVAASEVLATINLRATTMTPPDIVANPTALEFVRPDNQPYIVGDEPVRTVEIMNVGSTPFSVDSVQILSDIGYASFFQIVGLDSNPVQEIGGFESRNIAIRYIAPEPSNLDDPTLTNFANDRGPAHEARLQLISFEFDEVVEVPLRGWISYPNVDSGFVVAMTMEKEGRTSDLRNVDLSVEASVNSDAAGVGSFNGEHFCKRPTLLTTFDSASNGYVVSDILDHCEEDWAYGNARWSIDGAAEATEMIWVQELPSTEALDAEFRVKGSYVENCKRVGGATAGSIVGGILAIGNMILGGYTGVAVPFDAAQMAETVAESCWNRSGVTVNYELRADGRPLRAGSHTFDKHDVGQAAQELLRFSRENGTLD